MSIFSCFKYHIVEEWGKKMDFDNPEYYRVVCPNGEQINKKSGKFMAYLYIVLHFMELQKTNVKYFHCTFAQFLDKGSMCEKQCGECKNLKNNS